MARVLITGATGMLGRSLVPALAAQGHAVVRHSHAQPADVRADLTCRDQVEALLWQQRPDVIINLAALTNVDRCEVDVDAASRLNICVVEYLAGWIAKEHQNCHLVQVSTDMVYDGPGPNSEDTTVLRNVYALSKYAGELAALRVGGTVLRTNFFGRSACIGRQSFTDWICSSVRQGSPITVFDDVLFSPLSMKTWSELACKVILLKPTGVFNLGSREGLSKADFSLLFAASLGLPTHTIHRGQFSGVPTLKARRPTDMRMDNGRIEDVLGLQMPRLVDEIRRSLGEYVEQPREDADD